MTVAPQSMLRIGLTRITPWEYLFLGQEGVFRAITFGDFSKQNLIDALIRD